MTRVDVDDFDCPYCEEVTNAELDFKTNKHTCNRCGGKFSITNTDKVSYNGLQEMKK